MRRGSIKVGMVILAAVLAMGTFVWWRAGEPTLERNVSPNVSLQHENAVSVNDSRGDEKPSDSILKPDSNKKVDTAIQNVSFISQAPFGEWSDEVFQNACEEASMIMTMAWVHGILLTPETGKQEIQNITQLENKTFGSFVPDMSAADTARIMKVYYSYENIEVLQNVSIDDIKKLLDEGALVIAPMNGQALGNPHFTQPGPLEHMLVIIGYDANTKEFVTNDPGTKEGKNYRYDEDVLYKALREYPTGNHATITGDRKTIIAVRK